MSSLRLVLDQLQSNAPGRQRMVPDRRHVVVCALIEFAAGIAFSDPTPLLEEERRAGGAALLAKRPHPFDSHRPRTVAALSSHDHPVDVRQVDGAEVFEERFDGEKSYGGRRRTEMVDARQSVSAILDAHAPPNVR